MRTDRWAIPLALACVAVSLGVEALGWIGGLRFWPVATLVAAAGVGLVRWAGPVRPARAEGSRVPDAMIGLAVLTALVRAAVPPMETDELMYHLPLVRDALEAGRWRSAPDLLWAGYPRGLDHLFLVGYALAGEVGARLAAAGLFVLSILAVSAAGRAAGGPGAEAAAAARWAAASWATTDVVLRWAPACYVDVGLAASAAAALAAALRARAGEAPAWPAVLLAGFCASVKYTGVLVPLALLPAFGVRRGAAAVGAAVLFLAPTAARNVAHGLDPFAPYGASTHPYLRANELANVWDVNERWVPTAPAALAWDLAVSGPSERYQAQGTAMTPLLLYFLAAAPTAGAAGASALWAWCLSTWTLPQVVRFHLWAVALLAAAAVRPIGRAPGLFGAAAAILALRPLWRRRWAVALGLAVLSGAATPEEVLEARLGDFHRAMRAIAAEPGRTLLVGEPRTYYAGAIHPCDYTSSVGADFLTEPDPMRAADGLRAAGIDRVYVHGDAVDAAAHPVAGLAAAGRLEPLGAWGRHRLYRLK